ncbi:MAG: carboxypeptidase regulatory-like domain-containing protein [Elusimicrobia bacterium]|nr:carboxypeptidase regulatory-like domain-containing protein [Candidatus Liberimonas magnetica]
MLHKILITAFIIGINACLYADYTITTIAGNGTAGYSGDGGAATSAQLNTPGEIALDNIGNIYIADQTNKRIRKINSSGIISTIAGTGTAGFSGDGGLATSAQLSSPYGITVDTSNNVYFTDLNNVRVRKINALGIISTIAGTGIVGFSGDGGSATSAKLVSPVGIKVDALGNIYITDGVNYSQATISSRVRKISTSGIISTFAGTGTQGYTGDGGPATSAQFYYPFGIAADTSGNVYISDYDTHSSVVRKINASGTISTIAGTGTAGFSGDGGLATSAKLNMPTGLAIDISSNIYIYDGSRIRKISASDIISTIAGNGTAGYSGDGGIATSASIKDSGGGVAVDVSGNVYISDRYNHCIRKLTLLPTLSNTSEANYTSSFLYPSIGKSTSTFVFRVKYSQESNKAPGTNCPKLHIYNNGTEIYRSPFVMGAADITDTTYNDGKIYTCSIRLSASSNYTYKIEVFDVNGASATAITGTGPLITNPNFSSSRYNITTIAGIGGGPNAGYSGDGGPASAAKINHPDGVAVDELGNVYIADTQNQCIRKINTSGIITTIEQDKVMALDIDTAGNIYYSSDDSIKKIDILGTKSVIISGLNNPWGLVVDFFGNIYVAESGGNRVRKINALGTMTTIAGIGTAGYSGDEGLATAAKINNPITLAIDISGNVYVADYGNSRIRKIDMSGIITTIAGTSTSGYSGDGGAATSAEIHNPMGVGVDASGNIYISDTGNYRIRKINSSGIISTIAGNGTQGYSGDGGVATSASLSTVQLLEIDSSGNVYIDDYWGYIRKLTPIFTGNISGKVTKSDGTTALSGALLEVLQSNVVKSITTTDTSGYYSITIGTGTYDVKTSISGYQSQTKTGYSVANGSTITINFELTQINAQAQSGTISGKVTKSDGTTTISGVLIEAMQSGVTKASVLTDSSGNYSITVGTGAYNVKASTSGYQSQIKTGYNVTNGSTVTVNFSLIQVSAQAQTGTISCTVTDSNSTLIAGASIKIYQGSSFINEVYTDSTGKYSLTIGTGTYDFTVSKTGYQTSTQRNVSVTANQTTTINFSLATQTQTGTLFCNVQCNGIVVENALIRINQGNTLIDMDQTNSLGTYSLSLPPGTYDINVSKTGYQTTTQTGVAVSANQTTNLYISISLAQTTQNNQQQSGKQTTLSDNLFNPRTGGTCKIGFLVTQTGGVTIKICDYKGRQVRNVFDNVSYTAGSYQWNWDGKDDSGKAVSSGVYILYFKYPGGTETRKIGVK